MPSFDDALRTFDDRLRDVQREARIPGVAWGILREGALTHSAGVGSIRDGSDLEPDADAVFRIASMTKSFTAATVLLLRDEGRLSLDDEVARHVPALAAWHGPTADSPPITLRHLLTMSAGLPTDDPWGDRQQPLRMDAFEAFLAEGPSFAWTPGTAFDYSNLGYGILGRVITTVTGREYREVVEERLLRPLGLDSTRYRLEDLPAERVAQGHAWQGDDLVAEGMEPYGAFASMGGLFSSVRDLAAWAGEFLDAVPARDDPEAGHPLQRASRREMQQVQRAFEAAQRQHVAHEAPLAESAGYGFGLFRISDAEIGTVVWHSGGYPGFGSIMAWHPSTGVGMIGLGNLRYAPIGRAAMEELRSLVRAAGAPLPRIRPMPQMDRYRDVAEGLLAHWDDGVADEAFAMNMDLDQPRQMRRDAAARLADELGPFRRDEQRPVTATSPEDLTWWLRGEHGSVKATLLLTPEPSPRIQRMALEGVPDPSEALRGIGSALVRAANAGASAWPAQVSAGPDLDTGAVVRSLRAVAARLGSVRLGPPLAGDGSTKATFEVRSSEETTGGPTSPSAASIEITLEPDTGAVTAAVLRFTARQAPAEAW